MNIPILRKDFILDPVQIYQARAAGADAILLIAAALGKDQLQELYGLAADLKMTALLEVHNRQELEPVLELDPSLVGVNNRNLKTLEVDLKTSLELRPLDSEKVTVIAESGINTPQDVAGLLAGGLDGFLVGTSLDESPRSPGRPEGPGASGEALMVKVKICGITDLDDALAAVAAGADALGFVLAPSPRRVSLDQARDIIRALPPFVQSVGVFVNAGEEELRQTRDYCGLDLLQLSGDESEELASSLGRGVIKTLHVGQGREPDVDAYPGVTLILDTFDPKAKGGTGRAFDWGLAVEIAQKRPIILAGGLNPENVGRATALVKPYAVDVSSGVEIEPGRKDHDKIARFIARAKALDLGSR